MQAFLTYTIIALAVGYAVWKFVQRIRGKGKVCECGKDGTTGECPECHTECSNCPLRTNCNHTK